MLVSAIQCKPAITAHESPPCRASRPSSTPSHPSRSSQGQAGFLCYTQLLTGCPFYTRWCTSVSISHCLPPALGPQVRSRPSRLRRFGRGRGMQLHTSTVLWVCAQPLQSCLTLGHPPGCSPPGSSVRGSLQARILEWLHAHLQGTFPTQGWNLCPLCLLH